MLSSITPLGERGRGNRWWLTATAYVVGSVAGGASIGTVLGAVGALVRRVVAGDGAIDGRVGPGVLAAAAVVGVLADVGAGGLRVPALRRQVDERWLDRYRGWVYGVGYGFQLGVGVVTIVTSAATWLTLLAAVLTWSWFGGLVVGSVFGLVRSLPVLLTVGVDRPAALRQLHVHNQRWAGPAHLATLGAQGLVVVASLLALLGTT